MYIKVAKLRTGVGNAETSRTQCQNIQRALQVFYHDYTFSKSKSETGDNKKRNKRMFLFFKFSSINLLITLYQLAKFEAPSCNTF